MPDYTSKRRYLYDSLNNGGFEGLVSFDDFNTALDNPDRRKWLYTTLSNAGVQGLGSQEDFDRVLAQPVQAQTTSSESKKQEKKAQQTFTEEELKEQDEKLGATTTEEKGEKKEKRDKKDKKKDNKSSYEKYNEEIGVETVKPFNPIYSADSSYPVVKRRRVINKPYVDSDGNPIDIGTPIAQVLSEEQDKNPYGSWEGAKDVANIIDEEHIKEEQRAQPLFPDTPMSVTVGQYEDAIDNSIGNVVNDFDKNNDIASAIVGMTQAAREFAYNETTKPYRDATGRIPSYKKGSAQRDANKYEEETLDTLLKNLSEDIQGVLNDAFIDYEAKRLRCDVDMYRKEVAEKILDKELSSVEQQLINLKIPKDKKDYYISKLRDGLTGTLWKMFTQTNSQNQREEQAKQVFENNLTAWEKALGSGVELVSDTPFFSISGSITAASLKRLAARQIESYIAKGWSREAATTYINTQLANSLWKRFSSQLIPQVVGSSLNLGVYEGTKTAAQQMALEGELDAEEIADATRSGLINGAALGVFGKATSAVSESLSGGKKLLAEALGFGGEAAAFTASEEINSLISGDGWQPLGETAWNSVVTLAALKVTGAANPMGIQKTIKKINNVFHPERSGGNPYKFTPIERRQLEDAFQSSDILDNLDRLANAARDVKTTNGEKEGSITNPEAKELEEQVRKEIEDILNNPEIDYATRAKLALLLTDNEVQIPAPDLATFTGTWNEDTGKGEIITRSRDGSRITTEEVDSKEAFDERCRTLNYDCEARQKMYEKGIAQNIQSCLQTAYYYGQCSLTPQALSTISILARTSAAKVDETLTPELKQRLDTNPVATLTELQTAIDEAEGEAKTKAREDYITAYNYAEAQQRLDGTRRGLQRRTEEVIADNDNDIDDTCVKDNEGNPTDVIKGVTLKNGGVAYILSGDVIFNEDGTLNRDAMTREDGTMGLILARDGQTGDIIPLSADDIASGREFSAAEVKAREGEEIRQLLQQQYDDGIAGKIQYKVGNTYTLRDEDGKPMRITIVGALADKNGNRVEGQVVVQTADGKQHAMSMDDLQRMKDAADEARVTDEEFRSAEQDMLSGRERVTEEEQPAEQSAEEPAEEEEIASITEFADKDDLVLKVEDAQVNARINGIDDEGKITIITDSPVKLEGEEEAGVYHELSAEQLSKYVVERMPAETTEGSAPEDSETPQSVLATIPKDEQGNPNFEAVAPDVAFAGLVEQEGGSRENATKIAEVMAKNKRKAVDDAEKAVDEAKKALEKARENAEKDPVGDTPAAISADMEAKRKAVEDAERALADAQDKAGTARLTAGFWENVLKEARKPVEEVQPSEGQTPVTSSEQTQSPQEQEAYQNFIKGLEDTLSRLNVPITLVRSREEMLNIAREQGISQVNEDNVDRVDAFYDGLTNQIYFYAPRLFEMGGGSVEGAMLEAWKKIRHEGDVHYGLRDMFKDPNDYIKILNGAYRGMNQEAKERFLKYHWNNNLSESRRSRLLKEAGIEREGSAKWDDLNLSPEELARLISADNSEMIQGAADEYIAHLAEKISAGEKLTEEEQGIWDKIVQWLKETFGEGLTDDDLVQLILESHRRLEKESEEGEGGEGGEGAVDASAPLTEATATANGYTNKQLTKGVPHWRDETGADSRKRGYRVDNGIVYWRKEPLRNVVLGKETTIGFSDKKKPQARMALVEASDIEASHNEGQENVYHFLPDAQPNKRTDNVSAEAARKRAAAIEPAQIVGEGVAYTGAPIINGRGEVIQGNSRADMLHIMYRDYPEQAEKYKQYLRDNAANFGLTAEDVDKMKNPVLVRYLDVDDTAAVDYGKMKMADIETGSKTNINTTLAADRLQGNIQNVANILFAEKGRDTSDWSLTDFLNANGEEVLRYLSGDNPEHEEYITATDFQGAFNDDGNLTVVAKDAIRDILFKAMFKDAPDAVREAFDSKDFPDKARKALLGSMFNDYNSPPTERLIPTVVEAVRVYSSIVNSVFRDQFLSARTPKDVQKAIDEWRRSGTLDFSGNSDRIDAAAGFSPFAIDLAGFFRSMKQTELKKKLNDAMYVVRESSQPNIFLGSEQVPLETALEQAFKDDIPQGHEVRLSDKNVRFSIGDTDEVKIDPVEVEDERGRKSLVGAHNISLGQLASALQLGGLANPSVAIFDVDEGRHTSYGDVTLLLPSRVLVESLGKSAKAWVGDAYTSAFPKTEERDGRRYIKGTDIEANLKNISAYMNERAEANGSEAGLAEGSVLAPVLRELSSLEDMRENRGRLTVNYDRDLADFNRQWRGWKIPFIDKLSGDSDYNTGVERFIDTIQQEDPRAWAKEQYGIDLSDNDIKGLEDYLKTVQEDMPVRYFETKFNRPVYINEFETAVVPDDTPQEVVNALRRQGLQVATYKAGDNFDRMKVVREQASEEMRFSVEEGENNSVAERRRRAGERAVEALKRRGVDVVVDADEMQRVLDEAQGKKGERPQYLFAGEKGAANIDRTEATTRLQDLDVARQMESAGKDVLAIKIATGWERGVDGKWRYETPDYRAKDGFFNQAYTEELGRQEVALRDVLYDADELFEMYPELEDVKVRIRQLDDRTGGVYDHGNNTITINSKYAIAQEGETPDSSAQRIDKENSMLMHEIQHAIQYLEGFAEGADFGSYMTVNVAPDEDLIRKLEKERDELDDKKREIERSIDKIRARKETGYRKKINELNKEWWECVDRQSELFGEIQKERNKTKAVPIYNLAAGEVEARNVQKRRAIPMEQRRRQLAESTEDVAREDQVILHYGLIDGVGSQSAKGLQYLKTPEGEIYGFTHKGKVYLDPSVLDANTPVHEYTHIFDEALQKDNPTLWKQGIELLKRTPLWDEVKNMEQYRDIADDENKLASEVHSRLSGAEGQDYFEQLQDEIDGTNGIFEKAEKIDFLHRLRTWLDRAMQWVKDKVFDKSDMSLEEFVNMPLSDLLDDGVQRNEGSDVRFSIGDEETLADKIDNKASDLSKELGIDIDTTERGRNDRDKYVIDPQTGKISIVLGNHNSLEDVERSVLTSMVQVHSLRDIFGDRYNVFLDDVYEDSSPSVREDIVRLANANNMDFRRATQQYLADVATEDDFDANNEWWRNVKMQFQQMLGEKGFERISAVGGYADEGALNDNDLRYVLARNNADLQGVMGVAQDVAMQNELGVGNYRQSEPTDNVVRLSVEPNSYSGAVRLDKTLESLTDMAADTKRSLEDRNNALMSLTKTFQAVSVQGKYDRAIVSTLVNGVNRMISSGLLDPSRGETKRLLSDIKNALNGNIKGSELQLDRAVQTITDIVAENQLKVGRRQLEDVVKTKVTKVDASGVKTQGSVDERAADIITYFKNYGLNRMTKGEAGRLGITLEEGEAAPSFTLEQLEDMYRKAWADFDGSEEAGAKLTGLQLAIDYRTKVKAQEGERAAILEEKENSKEEMKKQARAIDEQIKKIDERLNDKNVSDNERQGLLDTKQELQERKRQLREDRREYEEAIDKKVLDSKLQSAADLLDIVNNLEEIREGGKERAKTFLDNIIAQRESVSQCVENDMNNISTVGQRKVSLTQKFVNNPLLRFLTSPLATYEQMFKLFGTNSPDGEGWLYNKFVGGWYNARTKEVVGLRGAKDALNTKASELFGGGVKRYTDLYSLTKKPAGTVNWFDNGEYTDHPVTVGNLLYIYMADKMSDGAMKLRCMGISSQKVAEIAERLNEINPHLTEMADWIQDEFLPQLREKYNETYRRMYGTSMDNIVDYVPLKIFRDAVPDKGDDSQKNQGNLSTTTSAIKQRTINNLPLDIVSTDGLAVILGNVEEMEHWNAFAELSRDLNFLKNDKNFRARVKNMTTIMGSGEALMKDIENLFRVAVGDYVRESGSAADKAVVAFGQTVASAKIAFRLNTALKQFASIVNYMPDTNPVDFSKAMAQAFAGRRSTWNWCMENIPMFQERWMSRTEGDTRLEVDDDDFSFWKNKWVDKIKRWGITPNAFVDALTVSIGTKAMYDTKYNQYIKDGYDKEEAHEKALRDAALLYNQTQQSSERAFVSTMQIDKTIGAVAVTLFRNASMSYGRQVAQSVRNLKRMATTPKWRMIENMKGQYMADGLGENEATAAAERRYSRARRKEMIRLATFAFIAPLFWRLAGQGVSSVASALLGGNQDDEKQQLEDAFAQSLMLGWAEGLAGGQILTETPFAFIQGENTRWGGLDSSIPLFSDIREIVEDASAGKELETYNEIINLAASVGLGASPETLERAVAGLIDYCGSEKTLRDGLILYSNITNVPQSQIKKMRLNELDITGEQAASMSPQEFLERYARAQRMSNAGLLSLFESEEGIEKSEKSAKKYITQQVVSRIGGEELSKQYDDVMERYKPIAKDVGDISKALNEDYKNATSKPPKMSATEFNAKWGTGAYGSISVAKKRDNLLPKGAKKTGSSNYVNAKNSVLRAAVDSKYGEGTYEQYNAIKKANSVLENDNNSQKSLKTQWWDAESPEEEQEVTKAIIAVKQEVVEAGKNLNTEAVKEE